MKVAPGSQSLCVSTLGDEVPLITLNLEVTKGLSLRALVVCGASDNFVRRQSLEDRRLKFVERVIPPTRLKVRLATGASIAVMKLVVGFHYTLEDLQYNDGFIVLDLYDKFDVILGLPLAQKVRAMGQLAAPNREDACHLFFRCPSDERLGASKSVSMYCE